MLGGRGEICVIQARKQKNCTLPGSVVGEFRVCVCVGGIKRIRIKALILFLC